MFITPSMINEVISMISNLQNCKSIGLGGFLASVVKSVTNCIAEPVTHILIYLLLLIFVSGKLKLAKLSHVQIG